MNFFKKSNIESTVEAFQPFLRYHCANETRFQIVKEAMSNYFSNIKTNDLTISSQQEANALAISIIANPPQLPLKPLNADTKKFSVDNNKERLQITINKAFGNPSSHYSPAIMNTAQKKRINAEILTKYFGEASIIHDWNIFNPSYYNREYREYIAIFSLTKLINSIGCLGDRCEEDVYRKHLCVSCLHNWLYNKKAFKANADGFCLQCKFRLEEVQERNESLDFLNDRQAALAIFGQEDKESKACLNCDQNRVIQTFNSLSMYLCDLDIAKISRNKKLTMIFENFILKYNLILLYKVRMIDDDLEAN